MILRLVEVILYIVEIKKIVNTVSDANKNKTISTLNFLNDSDVNLNDCIKIWKRTDYFTATIRFTTKN